MHLKDGTVLPADIVVLGVGVKPATSIFKQSGIALEKDGGISVDGMMRVKAVEKVRGGSSRSQCEADPIISSSLDA